MTRPFLALPALDRSLVTAEFAQRAAGAVIGSAVGDALGAPFEFGNAGDYTRRFPEPVIGGVGEMIGSGMWKPGEFTDDTQMAIVQVESLMARGGLDEHDLFERFRAWKDGAADVGIQTRTVLESDLVGSDAAAEHYRRTGHAAGNGTVMRATPTAVLLATAPEADTIEFARATSAVTHGDPATGWGTAAFHVLVRAALAGDDPWAALDAFIATLPEEQSLYREILAPGWTPQRATLGNGTVWTCLAQAVWAVRTTDTFEEAMVAAVDLGDDTDTVAAVAGGIAGAIHGIAAIPSRWTTYLNGVVTTPEGVEHHGIDDLRELCSRLLGRPHTRYTLANGAVVDQGGTQPHADLGEVYGPTEIAPGLYATNFAGAVTTDDDWAVISLCLVGDTLATHPVRREIHLVDRPPSPDGDHNLGISEAVADAVASIDAFLAEERDVVVHCMGGRSRTGLVLRAWLMASQGCSDDEAIAHIADRWPHLDLWNSSFTDHLATR